MANFGPLTAEIGLGVWGTHEISTGFPSWLRYCSDVVHRRPTKLCTTFSRLLRWYTIYSFSGAVYLLTEFCQFTLRSSHAFSRSGSVIAGIPAAGSAKLCGVVQGMELQNFRRGRHAPIFGWAAITLGIGSHSSADLFPGWNVANEIAKPQVCINFNNSSTDCKKTATVNGN